MQKKLVQISFSSSRWFAFFVIMSFIFGVVGCQARENKLDNSDLTVESSSTDNQNANYLFASNHLRITFNSQWQMSQDNIISVDVFDISQPLIFAAELSPQFTNEPIYQKPTVLNGVPVAENWKEIEGIFTVYKVDPSIDHFQIAFPALFFDSDLYPDGVNLKGWKIRVFLTSQIDAYAVRNDMSLEHYPITPQDISEQQTWIQSEPESQDLFGLPSHTYYIVPNSNSGVFLYLPVNMILDSITVESNRDFDFNE